MLWTLDGMLLICYYTLLVFECFVKKKNFVSTKCKQKICNIKEETKNENNSLIVISKISKVEVGYLCSLLKH